MAVMRVISRAGRGITLCLTYHEYFLDGLFDSLIGHVDEDVDGIDRNFDLPPSPGKEEGYLVLSDS